VIFRADGVRTGCGRVRVTPGSGRLPGLELPLIFPGPMGKMRLMGSMGKMGPMGKMGLMGSMGKMA
jgi:hypothetical protein